MSTSSAAHALYVHVPFCRQLCPYCDFAVAVRRDPPHEAYCDALLREWNARDDRADLTTVYFGGGTPGMWSLDALRRFCEHVDFGSGEATIEANPLDIAPERLDAWHACGFNRVSLGVQSFDDDALGGLGRDHDGRTAQRAVEQLVGDGRFRTSLDLIYGGPRYSARVLQSDITRAVALNPDHISAYQLTIEERTVFGRRQRQGKLVLPDDDLVTDLGFDLVSRLADHGFERYEVSSYGRAGDRAAHNSGYWLGRPYLGLGMGAHSYEVDATDARRRQNVRALKAYIADPLAGAEVEDLDPADHLGERLFLAARTTLGVPWRELRERFVDLGPRIWDEVARSSVEMQQLGWLAPNPDLLSATARGLDLADAIAERFWSCTRTG